MTWRESFTILALLLVLSSASAEIPPCATEDSPGPCVWDAEHQGNGRGRSFLVTEDNRVIYLTLG